MIKKIRYRDLKVSKSQKADLVLAFKDFLDSGIYLNNFKTLKLEKKLLKFVIENIVFLQAVVQTH